MSRNTASRGFSNHTFPCILSLHGCVASVSVALAITCFALSTSASKDSSTAATDVALKGLQELGSMSSSSAPKIGSVHRTQSTMCDASCPAVKDFACGRQSNWSLGSRSSAPLR